MTQPSPARRAEGRTEGRTASNVPMPPAPTSAAGRVRLFR